MRILKFTLIAVFLVTSLGLNAQEENKEVLTNFILSGEYRNIGEFRDGYKMILADSIGTEKMNPSVLVRQRIRISADYKSEKFDTKFTVHDIRVWGDNYTALSNNPFTLGIHEAWFKYKFNDKLGLKIGRQVMKYGDAHIIWVKGWNDYSAAHDALNLQYIDKDMGLKIDFALAINGKNENYYTGFGSGSKYYKDMAFLYAEKTFGESKVYFIDMLEERENVINGYTYARNTMGLSPELKFGSFNIHGGLYLQNGSDNVAKAYIDNGTTYVFIHEKMASMLLTAKAFYKSDNIKVGAMYENYSGEAYDDNGIDGINHTFTLSSQIYAAHKFLGTMDYYTGGQINKDRGINDINIFAQYGKKTNINASLHLFSYANDEMYMDGATETIYRTIGNELDLMFTHNLNKQAVFKLGYSIMLPGAEHLRYIDLKYESAGFYGTDAEVEQKTAQWVWVMFSFKPTFLNIKK